ncbi:MAG: biosynthetic-type acetolactate synthase large subunit [Clostridia bacterium]|nr:biosynthetic-type acetolactate synthase large subunit [Clostridia bacterium]
MKLTGSDILVKTLIEQGCDVVFGYPGGQILNVYDSLYKYSDEIRHVLSAHEQGAAHAADGYARATGRPGVVMATSGPGATNLVTGIATAMLDSVPMVAITGNVSSAVIGSDSFQEIDITGVTLPITKHNYFVGSVEDLADTVREAFTIATSGRPGPVLIDIPKDVQTAKCEYKKGGKYKQYEKFAAKDIRIREAAEFINLSKRPYIYVGGGVISSDASEEALALADLIDAPIGCSLMGISAVPTDHPRFLGMQGMHGRYASSIAFSEADCIIALGGRFNDRVTGNREKFVKNKSIIHIDIDGSELSKNVPDSVGLRGDLKLTLDKLLKLLKAKKLPAWRSRIKELKKEEEALTFDKKTLNPHSAIDVLNGFLSENTPVATDVGQHQMWAAQDLKFKTKRRFISSGGLGTMGFGMGAAIGASVGTGERAVLITGDGSFGMNLNELATAVTYKIPLVVLIMNNGVLGMVRQWQTLFFDRHYSNTTLGRKTDFTALARAFGADGEKVSTLPGLRKALKTAFSHEGPYVIDCAIGMDEMVFPMVPPGGSLDNLIVRRGE